MKHSSIISFLDGDILPEAFSDEIMPEVNACVSGTKSKGVGHVIVGDGPSMLVTSDHVARLLQALVDGNILLHTANYLADGLIMSDGFDFENNEVAEALHFLSDDSRLPTREEVATILVHLTQGTL